MTRNLLTAFFLFMTMTAVFAQQPTTGNWGVAVRQTWQDYRTPLDSSGDFNTDFGNMGHGFDVVLMNGIKDFLDITIPLRVGVANFPLDSLGTKTTSTTTFYGADALFKLHWPRKKNLISPYVVFGAGGMLNTDDKKADFQFPAGIGIDFRLTEGLYFTAESQYRSALTDYRTNIQHALGFTIQMGETKEKTPVALPPADSDGDGIVDKDDKCPNTPGSAALSGCPDADNDGVTDAKDDCPNEKGLIALNGCPDADGDGIADKDDKCPMEKGPVSNSGCPNKDRDGDGYNDDIDDCPDIVGTVNGCPDKDGDGTIDPQDKCPNVKGPLELDGCPDSDKDGIADKDDKCPHKAGTRANKGCPAMKKEDTKRLTAITKNIQFLTAKTQLRPSSRAILDEIASIMKKYPSYSVAISGHTDSVGSSTSNQKLSEGRAKTCYNYLLKKGIAAGRMSYTGYGETQPIADNMYKAGREQNRRVEFHMFVQ